MIVRNEVYIVYGQDNCGSDAESYYFFNKRDACKFAMENKGRMAYGIPTVMWVSTAYDTNDMNYHKCQNYCHKLSIIEIQQYAK